MVNAQQLLRDLFGVFTFIRVVALFVLITTNLFDLASLEYTFEIPGFGSSAVTFSFYGIIAAFAFLFIITLYLSLSIVGIGFNDVGTMTVLRYVSSVFLYLITGLGISYYLSNYAIVLFAYELFSTVIFVLYLFTTNTTSTGLD